MKSLTKSLDNSLLFRLLRENFRQHIWLYAVAIACMVLIAITTSVSAWIMRDLTDSSVVDKNFDRVLQLAYFIAFIFIVKGFATYFQSVYLSRAGNSIIATQQLKIYDRLIRQDVGFHSSNASSDLIVRVTHNAQAARSVIDTVVTGFVRDLLTLCGLIFVMVYQQPFISFAVFILGPIAIFSVRILLRRVRGLMQQEVKALSMIVQVMQETTIGVRVIKAFSLEPLMKKRLEEAVRDVEGRANAIVRLEAATSPIMESLGGISIAAIFTFSAFWVIQGNSTPGELMSFVTAMLLAYEPAKRLARMRVSIEAGLIAVEMMYELLDRPINLVEKDDAKPLKPGSGHVHLDRIHFGYGADKPIFDDLSLEFEAGKSTALVGPSGGGKSSMINLIMRLHDPVEGHVKVDGTDLRDVTFESLRKRISYVGQDTFLFAGSVGMNIGLGKEGATQEEIIAAAKAANAHDFIMDMEHGYDSPVGDNGTNLSGGQKQRVAIARAILKDSDILILDEATSALDSHTEVSVRDAIEHASKGRTTIIIAHRLSTIAGVDKIIYLDRGRVIEEGKPEVLLARNGPYRKLYDKQFTAEVAADSTAA